MSNEKNRVIVAKAKDYFKEKGYDIKTSHIYDVFSQLSGHKNWHIGSKKDINFEDLFKKPKNIFENEQLYKNINGILLENNNFNKNMTFRNEEICRFLITGSAGSGKSVFLKKVLTNDIINKKIDNVTLFTHDSSSYQKFCDMFNGEIIRINEYSKINIFEFFRNSKKNDTFDHDESIIFLISFFEIILSKKINYKEVYNIIKKVDATNQKIKMIHFIDEFKLLSNFDDKDIDILNKYTESGEFPHFDKDTNIKIDNSINIFELQPLWYFNERNYQVREIFFNIFLKLKWGETGVDSTHHSIICEEILPQNFYGFTLFLDLMRSARIRGSSLITLLQDIKLIESAAFNANIYSVNQKEDSEMMLKVFFSNVNQCVIGKTSNINDLKQIDNDRLKHEMNFKNLKYLNENSYVNIKQSESKMILYTYNEMKSIEIKLNPIEKALYSDSFQDQIIYDALSKVTNLNFVEKIHSIVDETYINNNDVMNYINSYNKYT